jgi:HSP20 family protein
MLTRWSGLHPVGFGFFPEFDVLDELRRRFDQVFEDPWADRQARTRGWPRLSLTDEGGALLLVAELPGFAAKDVDITVNQDVLTLKGEREVTAPEGYEVHRRERLPLKFSESFTLPAKVDLEKVEATFKDGLLTVNLPKVPEAQPRQIAVKTG